MFAVTLPAWYPAFTSEQIDLGQRESPLTTLSRMLHLTFFLYVLYASLFHYVACVVINPGKTHEGLYELLLVGEFISNDPQDQTDPTSLSSKPIERRCRKCEFPKPARAHHCTICKRCIMKMDHHCPWIHNCVGVFNYRYFYLFLVYITIGTGYFSIMSAGVAWKVFSGKTNATMGELEPLFVFAFLVAVVLSPILACFVVWFSWLIGTGQTSIEYIINQESGLKFDTNGESLINDYDLGTLRNFEEFFNISSKQ
ncbi:hypothetical protein BASA61_001735 [Batrachochytrium salamandrivorans]|nr:hypothetical protein BASA61_001735 [Batrachochytrium salamandrivorans]